MEQGKENISIPDEFLLEPGSLCALDHADIVFLGHLGQELSAAPFTMRLDWKTDHSRQLSAPCILAPACAPIGPTPC